MTNFPTIKPYAGPSSRLVTFAVPAALSSRGDVATVNVWFSYETPVAFAVKEGAGTWAVPVVRANVWGNTTGKHLAAIDGGGKAGKAARVDGDAFAAAYAVCLRASGVAS